MAEQVVVRIRSWREMWNDYIYEGIKKGVGHKEIRANLLEAFRKEVFDQMSLRLKVTDVIYALHTPENDKIVENIAKNAKKKWMRLVDECRKYPETRGLLRESDFSFGDEDEAEESEESRFEYEEVDDPEDDCDEYDPDLETEEASQ